MTAAADLKSTLNLPRTTFPMKASLAQSEPARLRAWRERNLYAAVRQARRGGKAFVLVDGPPYANGHIHLGHVVNKVLKDLMLRSRSLAGFDTPFTPCWDCHGLPIELQVDRSLGSKKREMSPLAFRQACRAWAEKFVRIQGEEFERLGVLADWPAPQTTMKPAYQATIVRQLADIAERGLVYKAKKSVHWCISCRTALAEAEIEYDEAHPSPSIDVRFPLGSAAPPGVAERLRGRRAAAVAWTTTPWTLPANLALAFHPEFAYGFFPVAGTDEVLLLARDLAAGAAGRWSGLRLEEPLAVLEGAELEGLRFRHPWIEREVPAVLGDHVTLEAGTGVVHTAPGHGWDDYLTGVRYGLDIYCPVDEAGRFIPEVAHFAGLGVFEANPAIVERLRAAGALLHASTLVHAYPVCWRCKKPVIFRATEQWFIGLDTPGAAQAPGQPPGPAAPTLRAQALDAIARVRWYPAWGEERIRNMVAGRTDWCISRQRLWGVPIPAFYCRGCSQPLLRGDLLRHLAARFEQEGADAWFAHEAEALLPPGFACPGCGGRSFAKERDILDVWFDSGSLHAVLLDGDPGLAWPTDMYLEGSDQHRGWFHSSLLIGSATRGAAPYREAVTHGFTVDAQGRKMSKSLGNDVDTPRLLAAHGAEILRLWVAMVDYREDMRFSEEMLRRVTEAYRKVRNTCRYLLSNLYDYDPGRHALPEDGLVPFDRYALHRHRRLVRRVRQAYEAYEFHLVYHQLVQYCAADLSAFYLDVLKDRLYCDPAEGRLRRSAQTVLFRIAEDLTLLMAPVLPFTADEVWEHLPGDRPSSVHLALFPAPVPEDEALLARWEVLLEVRGAVTKALEEARADRAIAASLEARVEVEAGPGVLAALSDYEQEGRPFPGNLAGLFIVSRVDLCPGAGPVAVRVFRAEGGKCERCWNYSPAARAPRALCERCAPLVAA
jgi:isoleucyl-tRNA synthetase